MRNGITEYIAKKDLIPGRRYKVAARNFAEATWDGERELFVGLRHKFGATFLDTELHWDDDPNYGTVKPLELIGE
jgi:hypothetical protein